MRLALLDGFRSLAAEGQPAHIQKGQGRTVADTTLRCLQPTYCFATF